LENNWRLVDLDLIDSFDTQAIYEAVGIVRAKNLVPNTIIFCRPSYRIVCIGYHQAVNEEINLDYCLKNKIPIVRRILGGGAVILDKDQQFYQVIVSRKDPKIPYSVEKAYEKLLKAIVLTCKKLGVEANYRPINDIEVNGKKISGNGATVLDEVLILTGNLILDFDYETMCNVLKVPSEKFKDKLVKSLINAIRVPPVETISSINNMLSPFSIPYK